METILSILLFLVIAASPIALLFGVVSYASYAGILAGRLNWKKWVILFFALALTFGAAWGICNYSEFISLHPIVSIILIVITVLALYFSFLILWFRFKGFKIAASIILSLLVVTIPIVILSWIFSALFGKVDFQSDSDAQKEKKEKKIKSVQKSKMIELKQKAKGGNLDALCDLAGCYLIQPHYNWKKSLKLYMKAAKKGSARAQFWVSEHANSYIRASKEDESKYKEEWNVIERKWLRKSAEQGYPEAMCKLGKAYRSFTSGIVAQDYEEAEKWLTAAAGKGNADAQMELGLYYSSNLTKKQDEQKSFEWLLKAAKGGIVLAQYFVAEEYWKGKVVPRNYNQALFWFEQAAEKKHLDAMIRVFEIYSGKNKQLHDAEKAKKWENKIENNAEYRERKKQEEKARRLAEITNTPVDYHSFQKRLNGILNKQYGSAVVEESDDNFDKIWNENEEMRIVRNVMDSINDPNYEGV